MRSKKFLFLVMGIMLVLFSQQAIYSQSHTIISDYEIASLEDDNVGTTWDDPEGFTILSWSEGVTGITGGFAKIVVAVDPPGGGIYKISLISVLSSDADCITGFWGISKNDGAPVVHMGTAEGLNASPGSKITIKIDGITIIIEITNIYHFNLAPEEVTGQVLLDDEELIGANVNLKSKSGNESTVTDSDGKYKFIGVEPDDLKKIVIAFKNYDPHMVLSGYVYVGGMPLVNAEVTVQNQEGELTSTTTDEDGYFETDEILDAVGSSKNKIKIIIVPE